MKHYAFILGREYILSRAEIIRVFQSENINGKLISHSNEMAIFEADIADVAKLFDKLGGSIKVAEVESFDFAKLDDEIIRRVEDKAAKGKRFNFGISVYAAAEDVPSSKLQKEIHKFGISVKKELKEKGYSTRLVTSKDDRLSSVVVNKNKLTSDQGIEIIVGVDKGKIWLGRTIAVQDFEAFSSRDYDRPARDDVSGMLPPKLARIMVNLAGISIGAKTVLLDPFCGSGTVLQEAALLGTGKVLGSDLSDNAVAGSLANIEWFQERFENNAQFRVEQVDVRELSSWLPGESVDVIVTEPYLGSPVRGKLSSAEISERQNELAELYAAAMEQFSKVLKKHGKVVIIFPFLDDKRIKFPPQMEKNFEIENISGSKRGGIDYQRKGQKVGREIFVLRKK